MEIIHKLQALSLQDRSQIPQVRNMAVTMAQFLGFNETDSGKVAIVVTELASNLIKHAKEGEIVLQMVENGGAQSGLDIYALDKGPGITDIQKALRDGFSTAGSPGTGLGAISRLSSLFDVYALSQNGSILFSRCWPTGCDELKPVSHGAISVPMPGEEMCGDSWHIIENAKRKMLLVVDGLGHGPLAADAARLAVRIFQRNSSASPGTILEAIHEGLRQTRGAAAAVAELDEEQNQVCYAGVGNISGLLVTSGGSRSMVSQNGTLGHEIYKISEFQYKIEEGMAVVMHSDGLSSHWDLRKYPGILYRSPSVIAGLLYRDWNKKRDDTTVLVYRNSPEVFRWTI